jgi:hypothetical protein
MKHNILNTDSDQSSFFSTNNDSSSPDSPMYNSSSDSSSESPVKKTKPRTNRIKTQRSKKLVHVNRVKESDDELSNESSPNVVSDSSSESSKSSPESSLEAKKKKPRKDEELDEIPDEMPDESSMTNNYMHQNDSIYDGISDYMGTDVNISGGMVGTEKLLYSDNNNFINQLNSLLSNSNAMNSNTYNTEMTDNNTFTNNLTKLFNLNNISL